MSKEIVSNAPNYKVSLNEHKFLFKFPLIFQQKRDNFSLFLFSKKKLWLSLFLNDMGIKEHVAPDPNVNLFTIELSMILIRLTSFLKKTAS